MSDHSFNLDRRWDRALASQQTQSGPTSHASGLRYFRPTPPKPVIDGCPGLGSSICLRLSTFDGIPSQCPQYSRSIEFSTLGADLNRSSL